MKYLKNVRNVNYFKLMGAQCLKITKKLIQHCERSELRLHFQLIKNAKNSQFWRVFENLKLEVKQRYQTDQF